MISVPQTLRIALFAPYARHARVVGDIAAGLRPTEEGWHTTELSVDPGVYRYRFLLDGFLWMNDPGANGYEMCDDGRLLSVRSIGEKDSRLPRAEKPGATLESCRFCSEVSDEPPPSSLTTFPPAHEKVVCHLRFVGVSGLHTVNILWFTPAGEFFFNSEAVLWRPPRYPHRHVDIWGWLDLQERPLPPGGWTVLVLLDGAILRVERFNLLPLHYALAGGRVVVG